MFALNDDREVIRVKASPAIEPVLRRGGLLRWGVQPAYEDGDYPAGNLSNSQSCSSSFTASVSLSFAPRFEVSLLLLMIFSPNRSHTQ